MGFEIPVFIICLLHFHEKKDAFSFLGFLKKPNEDIFIFNDLFICSINCWDMKHGFYLFFGQFPDEKTSEIELAWFMVCYYFHIFYGLSHGVF